MNDENADAEAVKADHDSVKFRLFAWLWRFFTFVLIGLYVFDVISEKVIFVILLYMSGAALAISNEGKSEAARARKASYENP